MRPKRVTSGVAITPDILVRMQENHARVLSGNVEFGNTNSNTDQSRNIRCFMANGTTPGSAGTNFTITHTLGRVPITFFGHTTAGVLNFVSSTKTTLVLTCTASAAGYQVVVI